MDIELYKKGSEDFIGKKQFKYINTYKLMLSSLYTTGHKYEPMFVYKNL